MEALILTGGQGTRLRPLTATRFKPLLPLANRPFLSYPLGLLKKHGVRRAILCTSGNLRPYRSLIADQREKGMALTFSMEKRALGTAGALKNAERHLRSDSFFVLNGDILSDMDLEEMAEFHERNKAQVTLALIRVPDPSHYGLVLSGMDGRVRKFMEKPKGKIRPPCWINCGIYLFERRVLRFVPKNRPFSAERELFPQLLRKKIPIFAFKSSASTYWMDIGAPRKYLQANLDILQGRDRGLLRLASGQAVAPGARIHPQARISKRVVLGKNCRVGKGAVLDRCVVLEGTVVEEGALVENCVVGENSRIGAFSRIQNASAIGPESRVTPFSLI